MIKRYFVTGLLVLIPLWVTVLLVKFLVDFFDNILQLIPHAYRPEVLLGFRIPGIGLLLTIILVFIIGVLVTNIVGKKLLTLWEAILNKIPIVRSIYSGVKKVTNTVLDSGNMSFRKVVLVEFPRKDLWSIAFQTSSGFQQAEANIGKELVTIFIPTTPNPTSGFLMVIPKKDVIELNISVDEALKMVISLGVILPQ